ncbi:MULTISPECIES: aminotransferase class I/II-fold pyridoxal phosphate-dependent enzyme [Gracilibacillus]|uniref:aminotransferase class I/II-fold pyridoxal phosphate-dependent enzyme n=1 Tax=Gracilibacillus TaxID=74385 RepID=UPI00082530DB|nr:MULTISPECIES: aminotransferase class I/II-fold pyridoxal phosphate-dependent enzyme [Gracilibacillus]
MIANQQQTPLYAAVKQFADAQPISFHVPGHKNGKLFAEQGLAEFQSLLSLDITELNGLDDLHAPEGVIADAQELASEWFHSLHTFFLINGSTVGNLTMILACCQPGDMVLVQRNCHKSILHGMELAGVKPIFLPPSYDKLKQRYIAPSTSSIKQALTNYTEAKAIILTYPDYFGDVFPLKEVIDLAHRSDTFVLIDEAHGCHFSLPFVSVPSAGELGADVVVQSAHKMTPAMTMSAYLHVYTSAVPLERVHYYLQLLQSSSPSYPLMVSLDLARYYLANYTEVQYKQTLRYIKAVQECFVAPDYWEVEVNDDPLKMTLRIHDHLSASQVQALFEEQGIYPELITDRHVLFIFGLEPVYPLEQLQKRLATIRDSLKHIRHAKIDVDPLFFEEETVSLALSYQQMNQQHTRWCRWEEAAGKIAAEAIIPYPPGIPLIAKGERIKGATVAKIKQLFQLSIGFQPSNPHKGIYVYEAAEGE